MRGTWVRNDLDDYYEPIHHALESVNWTNGREVKNYEREFAERVGVKYAIALNSGTAALTAIMVASELSGKEIIVPAFTFSAVPLSVIHAGATPVFVDVDPYTLTIDPNAIEEMLEDTGGNVGGIVAVNTDGVPANFANIRTICSEHDLVLIEDACPSFGSSYGQNMAGSLGDAAAFSLNQTKIIGIGEGGVVTTDDHVLDAKIRALRDFGEFALDEKPMRRQSEYAGYNWKLGEIAAMMARVALAHSPKLIERAIHNVYEIEQALYNNEWLSAIAPYNAIASSQERTSVRHKIRIALDHKIARADFENWLDEYDIPYTRREVLTLPDHPAFAEYPCGNVETSRGVLDHTFVLGNRMFTPWTIAPTVIRRWARIVQTYQPHKET